MTEQNDAQDDNAQPTNETTQPPAESKATTEVDWKAEARKWEARAKDNASKLKAAEPQLQEWQALKEASQTELERTTEQLHFAAQQVGALASRAVRAEVKAAASGFAYPEDAHLFLGDLNRYVDPDSGDVDTAAISGDLKDVLSAKPRLAASAERRIAAPDRTQASGANGPDTSTDPKAQFAAILNRSMRATST